MSKNKGGQKGVGNTATDKKKDEKNPVNKPAAAPVAPAVDPKNNPKVEIPAKEPVEKVEAEEVQQQTTEKKSAIDLFNFNGDVARFNNSEANTLLDIMERRTARMKANAPQTIRMEALLDHNLAWQSIKLSAQFAQEKKALGLLVPNEEAIISEFIETYNSLGVALHPAGETSDGKQQVLQFKESDISSETKQAVKEEVKVATKPAPELDPKKWGSNEEAKKGLFYQICAKGNFGSNVLAAMTMTRLFRENQEQDPVKKELWKKAPAGDILKDMMDILGNKGTTIIKGLGSSVCNSLKNLQNPIFGHCIVKRNISSLSEEDTVSIVKAFVEKCNANNSTPVDQLPEVLKGFVSPTRELFLKLPAPVSEEEHKIFGVFQNAYRDILGPSTEPNFSLKATNIMIDIANRYRDKDAQLKPYTESEYPKAIVEIEAKPEEKTDDKDKK